MYAYPRHPDATTSIFLMSSNYLPHLLFSPMWISSCLSSYSFCHVTIRSDNTATRDFDNVSVIFIEKGSRDASHSSPELLNSHRLTELVGYFLWGKVEKFHGCERIVRVSRHSHHCCSPLICRQQRETPQCQALVKIPQLSRLLLLQTWGTFLVILPPSLSKL